MKLPTLKEARDLWNVTKIDISQHDQAIDSLRVILQQKYMVIIRDIKNKGSIVGLSQYKLNTDEAYAMHMMLILNDNVILQEENGFAKYTYVNNTAKEGLGIKAFGLYWLSDEVIHFLYKRHKMHNQKVFQDTCFILNNLIGFAFQHKSSVSNDNVFNMNSLARNLFMQMDQFLLAISTLRINKLVYFKRVDHNFNFKFDFCEFIANDIESQLSMAKIATEEHIMEENNLIENNYVKNDDNLIANNTSEENTKINVLDSIEQELIEYLKKETTIYYSPLLASVFDRKDININVMERNIVRNKLSHHPQIIFRPQNFDSTKKISYVYQYVTDDRKQTNFSDYCIFRFVIQRVCQALQQLWKKYDLKIDMIDMLWILDHFNHKLNTKTYTRFNSALLKQLGVIYEDNSKYVEILRVLQSLKMIDVININCSSKRFFCDVKLIDKENYTQLKQTELVSYFDTCINEYLSQSKQDELVSHVNTCVNKCLSSNNNEEINKVFSDIKSIDIKFSDKESSNKESLDTKILNEENLSDNDSLKDNDLNKNLLSDKNVVENDSLTKEKMNNFSSLESTNKILLDNIKLLQQEKEKLVKDNANLLVQLTELRNNSSLTNINLLKQNISNNISLLLNNVITEIHNMNQSVEFSIKLNSQKHIIKMITDMEQNLISSF